MSDVYYVSSLKHNLMTTWKLLQKGYKIYMEDNDCVITDNAQAIFLFQKSR